MTSLFKRKIAYILFFAIVALGFFLRSYHFSDWLHFELDQSRDAKIIDVAVKEGPENLPLLGPKAAGSFLRLGPVFYYFNYISALIFGDTPSGMAMIMMVFGSLAIPAFYLLARRYFDRWISLALLLMFSVSLFLVMYSRFSWNPNPLPLFTILTMYSLLKAVDHEERHRGRWLLGAAFFLAVATQLHFLAFVSLPLIAAVFLIIKRPKIRWAYWIGALGIILVMNLPVILNEIKTGGKNFMEFKEVAMGKTNKDTEKTFFAKLVKDYSEHSVGHFLILSAQNTELPKVYRNPDLNVICDEGCRKNLPLGATAVTFFSLGVVLLLKNILFEKDTRKRDFVILSSLWFAVAFVLFLPLSYDISPRYWLLISALPFIFVGLSFELLKRITPKKFALVLIVIITLGFAASNLYQTYTRFEELRKASSEPVKISVADRILKEGHRVTLEQQYMIIDYIEELYQQNGYPVYLNSDPFYRRSLLFHLDMRNILRDDFRNISNNKKVYRNGNYFLVYPTNSNIQKDIAKYADSYTVIGKKEFGTLTVIQLSPKEEAITGIQQEIEPKGKPKTAAGVPERYTWEDVFNDASSDEKETE